MNIIIPAAGKGERLFNFSEMPKPFIDISGKPMIQYAVETLNIDGQYIFVVWHEHLKFGIEEKLKNIVSDCKIIVQNKKQDGAVKTCLLAEKYIDNKDELIICNSDHYIEWDSKYDKNNDGWILVFEGYGPKWSYAKINDEGYVTETKEKVEISNIATGGVYGWKHGDDFVKYSKRMINKNIMFNNEYYVCPVYNEAINDNKKITIKYVKQWDLGNPIGIDNFISKKLNKNYI